MSQELLKITDLSVEYRTDKETVHAVNHIHFSPNRGETIGLVGETGAGKTTTALSIMRLLPEKTGFIPNGTIEFEGRRLFDLEEKELHNIRGKHIAMIFQDPMTSLNPIMTVGEQIAEALELHNTGHKTREQIEARVDEVLSMVGISPSRKNAFPHQFSGGMKQRVVIAMALVCEPDLLIADEPTTALDVTIQAQVINMIRELRDRLGTAMIMITHDLGIVAQTCDNVAVMYAGRIIEAGTAFDIYKGEFRHPYTVGLFSSIPNLREKTARLTPIPGLMPDPTKLPAGCSFAPRCPRATELCRTTPPGAYRSGTHVIECHLLDGKDGWTKEARN